MKKILFTTLMLVSLGTTNFASATDKKFLRAEYSLQNQFKNISKVEWTNKHGMMKASFMENGRKTEAYFGSDGEIIATCKMISPDEIPDNAKIKLAQKFAGYKITEAITYKDAEGEAYFVSAANATTKVIVKSKAGMTSVFQKTSL